MRVHKLKCEEPHWSAIRAGRKRFELRLDDRNYKVGDILELTSWTPLGCGATETQGQKIRVEVLHMIPGDRLGDWGLKPNVCCMSIRLTGEENAWI